MQVASSRPLTATTLSVLFVILLLPGTLLAQHYDCAEEVGLTRITSSVEIDDGPSIRALLVYVKFADDTTPGRDGWPLYTNPEDLPTFADGILAPDSASISSTDSTLSRFYYDQSKATSTADPQLFLYGDILPTDGSGNPIVYVTDHDNDWYHRSSGRGYGYLTEEVLDYLVNVEGIDIGDYDVNDDGYLDHIFLIIRHEEAEISYSGASNLGGYFEIGGEPSDSLLYWSPGKQTNIAVDWYESGSFQFHDEPGNIVPHARHIELAAHEIGHDLLRGPGMLSNHLLPQFHNDVPANDPPVTSPQPYGHALMPGSPHRFAGSYHTISVYERWIKGWIDPIELENDSTNVEITDLPTTSKAFVIELDNDAEGTRVFIANRQRNNHFTQLKSNPERDPPFDDVIVGLEATGLAITYNRDQQRLDVVPADNTLERDVWFDPNPSPSQNDFYNPWTQRQVTPWTRPNSNGYNEYPSEFSPSWVAIDNITNLGNPDSTMKFDFYSDYRDAALVAIRADSWMGEETSGSVFANEVRVMNGATLTIDANTELEFASGLTVEKGAELIIHNGAELAFGTDALLDVLGTISVLGSVSTPVVFDGDDGTYAWDGIYIKGDDSQIAYAEINGAEVGLELAAEDVVVSDVELSDNGIGILTDYQYCVGACGLDRSVITLDEVTITGSNTTGITAANTNISISNSSISSSGSTGLVIQNADVVPFVHNVITGNGISAAMGISVLSNGDLTMGPSSGTNGYNQVYDNLNHELYAASGATALVGASGAAGGNVIYKTWSPSFSSRYIYNDTGQKLEAKYVWWDDTSGPPAGAFTGTVDYSLHLLCFPTDPPACRIVGPGSRSEGVVDDPTASAREREDWATWLRREIQESRTALTESPGSEEAAGHVFRLSHLQRLDRENELGERATTFALLTSLRNHLDNNASGNLKRTAYAALEAEVRAALYEDRYDDARVLIGRYSETIDNAENSLPMDLAEVSLFEQERDYENALSRLQAIIAGIPAQEEYGLADELSFVASIIERKIGRESGARGMNEAYASASVKAGGGERIETFALDSAYPNPFNPSVLIPFAIPEAARVEIQLFDMLGRRVATVTNREFEPGAHTVQFDGSELASGVYVMQVIMQGQSTGAGNTFTQQITLLK